MDAVTVQIEGADKFRRNLRRLDKSLPKGMKLIHQRIAGPVAARAKAKAPSRSGALRSKIRPTSTTTMARVTAGPLIYAPIIEFGGYPGNYQGQSYLYAACGEMRAKSIVQYERELEKWIDLVWDDN